MNTSTQRKRVNEWPSIFTCLRCVLVWMLLAWLSCTHQAHAHKPSDSYLKITGGGEQLAVQWDIALKDLQFLIGLDTNRDGDITWGELKAQRSAIAKYALSRLDMTADGIACNLQLDDLLVTQHSDGAYAALQLKADGPGDAEVIDIDYSLLFELDPTHRGLVLYDNGLAPDENLASTHVLTPDSHTLSLNTTEAGLWRTLGTYIWEGVWHIWIGFDHILFLISLLIPAVLVRTQSRPEAMAKRSLTKKERKQQNKNNQAAATDEWQPVETFPPACKQVLKIVTVFTVAHSITLWLAVMEYMTFPGWIIEATIAFSIIVTAANNLWPVLHLSGWMIAFAFGLVHGFGFANVLLDLGLSSTTLAVSLFGFNVGVELGQLAIVMVFLPIAYALRRTKFYKLVILKAGSVAIAVIAALWMIERVGDYAILPF